jgi:hypothetical protein
LPARVDCIVGMGETGSALFNTFKDNGIPLLGKDKIPQKSQAVGDVAHYKGPVGILHICLPFTEFEPFKDSVLCYIRQHPPTEVVIHSSVAPGTTAKIQHCHGLADIPVIYSPIRGVHSRMEFDLKRYTKYWAVSLADVHYLPRLYPQLLNQSMVKGGYWANGATSLELAKILMDTTYYGFLIVFAQHVKEIAQQYGADEGELWRFTEEIHQYLGNRPKMFSGDGIGGHCVLPNLELLDDEFFDMVFAHDKHYRRNLGKKQ